MKLIPLGDLVLVRPAEKEEKSRGGVLLPDNAKEKPSRGEVLAVGPGKRQDDGTLGAVSVRVGQVVLFQKYGVNKVEIEGEEYLLIPESEILGTVSPD